jgi:uncharacterized protein
MTRLLRLVPLLVFVMLWSAGCTATSQPTSPSLPPAATAIPAKPTALPLSDTPTNATAKPLEATVLPTNTLTNEQKQTMTEQLIQAAEAGDTATVQQRLRDGADINGRDAQGRTPVMAATHGNQVDTVRALIQAGADINIRDNRMDNPFLYAGAEGRLDILKLTIDAGADTKLTNRFGGTALIPAAERGHVEIVKELLTRTNVNVNHVNNLGWTALLEAIVLSNGGEKHQQIVQLLVDHGADITIPDKDGVTPLEHARQRGYEQIIKILQQAGAR